MPDSIAPRQGGYKIQSREEWKWTFESTRHGPAVGGSGFLPEGTCVQFWGIWLDWLKYFYTMHRDNQPNRSVDSWEPICSLYRIIQWWRYQQSNFTLVRERDSPAPTWSPIVAKCNVRCVYKENIRTIFWVEMGENWWVLIFLVLNNLRRRLLTLFFTNFVVDASLNDPTMVAGFLRQYQTKINNRCIDVYLISSCKSL